MVGVPASEINEIIWFDFNIGRTVLIIFFELC